MQALLKTLRFRNAFSVALAATVIYQGVALACATSGPKPSSKNWKAYFKAHKSADHPLVRDPATQFVALPSSKQNPWGGSDATHWKPEAILANAASDAINESSIDANVKDVLVAIPLTMQYSSARPYADGQTNSAVSFGKDWKQSQPPLVVTLIQYEGGMTRIKFRMDPTVLPEAAANASPKEIKEARSLRLVYHLRGAPTSKTWTNLEAKADGNFEVVWTPSANEAPVWGGMYQNHVAFVQLGTSPDWYPIDFRDVVLSAHEMLEQIPESLHKLGKGTPLDPELISVQGPEAMQAFPFLGMESESFGKDLNADRYFPVVGSGIHNEFPDGKGVRITAVGHGNTLVMIKPPSAFKSAYICFDKRDQDAEATAGVPSGGGWHEIGDPAETVMNTLETDPVLFGYANGQPAVAPPSGGFARGLSDVAVIRKLRPGSALITAAGDTTAAEDASGWKNRATHATSQGRNYHWFAFNQPHEICAVEWVHPDAPSASNHLGFESLWK